MEQVQDLTIPMNHFYIVIVILGIHDHSNVDVHGLQACRGRIWLPISLDGERLVWDLAITLCLNPQLRQISTKVVTYYKYYSTYTVYTTIT